MKLLARIEEILESLKAEGGERRLTNSEGISFSHNDYLGISGHPRLVEAAKRAVDVFGTSSRGSRLLGGNSRIYEEAEEAIARFFGSPSALFFSSGYLANLAVTGILGECCDEIFSDSLNHASLIDGIKKNRNVPVSVVPHNSWKHFDERRLNERSLVVTESLFSMDGDFVDVGGLTNLLASGAFLLVDEAHAAGISGLRGEGYWLSQVPRVDWARTAVTVTFGKAFGASGAAILCCESIKQLLINRARPFIFTTAPPPSVPATVLAALEVVSQEDWRRRELWSRAERLRGWFQEAIPCGLIGREHSLLRSRQSPIIPILIPGPDRALRFSENMRESGIELKAIRHPTVSRGLERVRISLNLGVSRDNTEWMARKVITQWMAFSSQAQTQA